MGQHPAVLRTDCFLNNAKAIIPKVEVQSEGAHGQTGANGDVDIAFEGAGEESAAKTHGDDDEAGGDGEAGPLGVDAEGMQNHREGASPGLDDRGGGCRVETHERGTNDDDIGERGDPREEGEADADEDAEGGDRLGDGESDDGHDKAREALVQGIGGHRVAEPLEDVVLVDDGERLEGFRATDLVETKFDVVPVSDCWRSGLMQKSLVVAFWR